MTRRRALTLPALAVVLLTAGCGASAASSAGPPTPASSTSGGPSAGSPSAAPPTAAAPGGQDAGSGIAPPVLQTYGAKLSDRRIAAVRTPVRLRVPDIGVDGTVGAIGVAADGQLAVPATAGSLSWYRFGPSPGDPGSAVVAGHVDYNGAEGVFWRLDELRPGQRIDVGYDDGSTRTFTVSTRQQYPKSALPVDDVFAGTGAARLVLITCGGSFDSGRRSYRDNVVVTALPS